MSLNPAKGIAPPADNNELLRRILGQMTDVNGNPLPGTPLGPLAATQQKVTVGTATGPLPQLGSLIVPANDDRTGMLVANLDQMNTMWFSTNPNVTGTDYPATQGTRLRPFQSVKVGHRGPIYAYSIVGTVEVEVTEDVVEND